MRLSNRVIGAIMAFVVLGAGCSGGNQPPAGSRPNEVTGPKPAVLENATPAEAANMVNFVVGSFFELKHPPLIAGAPDRTRVIVLDRFAPMEATNLTWKLSTQTETAASKKARDAAKREGKPLPEPVYVTGVVNGNVDGISLKNSASFYLPGYWPDETRGSSYGSNGIWLSVDAFEGLARNRVATVDYGILDSMLNRNATKNAGVRDALARLSKQKQAIENRKDVMLLTGEPEPIEWAVNVNGKDVKVQAFKAKTWFGEIIVLNNKQNPLVLKFALDPALGKLSGMSTAYQTLRLVLDFEVTKIGDVQ